MAGEKKSYKFSNRLNAVKKFFRDCLAEIKKIIWPTPKAAFRNMGVVLLSMLVIGLFVFGLDTLFLKLLGLIMNIAA